MGLTTTTISPLTTKVSRVTAFQQQIDSAVVTSTLTFNYLSPVPSEAHVLRAIKTLRDSRESKLDKSLKLLNVTYNKISETSYELIFEFNLSNISTSNSHVRKGNPAEQVQNAINAALNTLLNDPQKTPFVATLSNVTTKEQQIEVFMNHVFMETDDIQPVSFLNELRSLNSLTTTPTPTILVKVLIYIKLVFKTRGHIPSESAVLQVANKLLDKRLRSKRDLTVQKLSDPVSFVNITYTKISDNSYALKFGFEISNVRVNEKVELRDGTYKLIQDSINKLLNEILSDPTATPFVFNQANFT
ncbi:uncharacterized protein [Misgurnus anguillicaudatus]|uniref:uncharacterized protein n=1 Tax=Misgurnus anguillicaudatus TaxID=75329 RepID=UPI003CCF3AB9